MKFSRKHYNNSLNQSATEPFWKRENSHTGTQEQNMNRKCSRCVPCCNIYEFFQATKNTVKPLFDFNIFHAHIFCQVYKNKIKKECQKFESFLN